MEIGQAYVPYRMFVGVWIPNGIMQHTRLTATAKLVFGELSKHAGERDVAFPSYDLLARECGMSRRSVANGLDELQREGLIRCVGLHKRRRMWQFLWHACLEGSVRRGSVQDLPTSKRGTMQDLPTTPNEEPDDPEEPTKCADFAHDSRQDLPEIVGKICTVHLITENSGRESHEGRIPPPPSPTSDADGADSPARARSPDEDVPTMVFRALCRNKPDPEDLEELAQMVDRHGSKAVLQFLEAAGRTKTCRGSRVIPYLRTCFENDASGKQEEVRRRGIDDIGL